MQRHEVANPVQADGCGYVSQERVARNEDMTPLGSFLRGLYEPP